MMQTSFLVKQRVQNKKQTLCTFNETLYFYTDKNGLSCNLCKKTDTECI